MIEVAVFVMFGNFDKRNKNYLHDLLIYKNHSSLKKLSVAYNCQIGVKFVVRYCPENVSKDNCAAVWNRTHCFGF